MACQALRAMRAQGIDVISVRRGRARLRHPEPHQGRARCARWRGGPDEATPRSAASPSFAPPSATSSSATTGSSTRPTRSPSPCGAKHTLYNIVMALVNPGDEVLDPQPYWVSYPEQVRLLGGVPVACADAWSPPASTSIPAAARAVTPRTKARHPRQPRQSDRRGLLPRRWPRWRKLALEHGLWVVSDECYEARSPTRGATSPSPRCLRRSRPARSSSIPAQGLRDDGLAYRLRGRPRDDHPSAMTDIQSQVTSNPASIAQWAAVEALDRPRDEIAKMVGEFDRRRRFIIEALNAVAGRALHQCRRAPSTRVPQRLGPLRQALEGRRDPRSSADVCAFLLEDARIASRGRRGLRLRRSHPHLRTPPGWRRFARACAAWTRPCEGWRIHEDRGRERDPRRAGQRCGPPSWTRHAGARPSRAAKASRRSGPGEYKAIMKVGVAAIKGTFEGQGQAHGSRAAQPVPDVGGRQGWPRLRQGRGGACHAGGESTTDHAGELRRADVQVGGLIASVGQRMLGGVSEDDARSVLHPGCPSSWPRKK